jgi:putative peptidoglycan lipid II flippase
LRAELRTAFSVDFVFGIDGSYDNILTMAVQTLVSKTQNTILSAAFIISISSGISALLGVVKNRLLAGSFGISKDLTVFYTADNIPSLIYSILIVGVVSTVFIPVFASLIHKDKEKAFHVASTVINSTILLFLLIGTVIFVFAPTIIKYLALGQFTPEEVVLGANLMRIMIFAQIILVAGSLATSVLQSFRYFLAPALAPIVYNAGMIAGILFLSPKFGIYGPAVGVVIGAILHLLVQLPFMAKTGFKYMFRFGFGDKEFRKTLVLIPPRIISVLIAGGLQTLNSSLVLLIAKPSVVILKFANQLQGFPVNIFGFSIAAAALPTLATLTEKGHQGDFKKIFITSLHQTMFLVMPLSMILVILRVPVVRLVYGVSNFPWLATIETASVLAVFAISIFSQSANYLITRAFHSLKDTLTPVLIGLCTALLNVSISLYLITVLHYSTWSVAFSFSVTSLLDTVFLLYFLDKKVSGFETKKLLLPFVKISLATILMGFTLYFPIKLLDQVIFDTTRTINLLMLTLIAGFCGGATYLLFTKLLKVEEIDLFYKLISKLHPAKTSSVSETPFPTETTIEQA